MAQMLVNERSFSKKFIYLLMGRFIGGIKVLEMASISGTPMA